MGKERWGPGRRVRTEVQNQPPRCHVSDDNILWPHQKWRPFKCKETSLYLAVQQGVGYELEPGAEGG